MLLLDPGAEKHLSMCRVWPFDIQFLQVDSCLCMFMKSRGLSKPMTRQGKDKKRQSNAC